VDDLLLRAQDEIIQLKRALREHEEQAKKLNARLLRATKDATRAHANDDDKGGFTMDSVCAMMYAISVTETRRDRGSCRGRAGREGGAAA
jgi:hypothetical protein